MDDVFHYLHFWGWLTPTFRVFSSPKNWNHWSGSGRGQIHTWWHILAYLFFCSLSAPLRYEMLPHHGHQALSFDPREELFGNHSHLENCICSQNRQNCAIEATKIGAIGITWCVLASLILLRPSASVSGQRKSNLLYHQLGLRKNLSAWHSINCAWKMRKMWKIP